MKLKVLMIPLALALLVAGCAQEEGETAKTEAGSEAEAHEGVAWMDYESGMAQAQAEGKYVLIDFWTDWCHWCKVLDERTYTQESVQTRLAESFVAVKVDAESREPQGKAGDAPTGVALARNYGVQSYPTTWFLDTQGEPIAPAPGFMEAEQLVIILDYVSTGAYKDQEFQAYMKARSEG